MTKSEQVALILENQRRFYSWEPPEIFNPFQIFKCWHIEPYPQMSDEKCRARGFKPELYMNAGCGNRCPRWRYYRKLAKKALEPKPIRIPYL